MLPLGSTKRFKTKSALSEPCQDPEVKNTFETGLNTTAYTCTRLIQRLCMCLNTEIVFQPSPTGLLRVTVFDREGSCEEKKNEVREKSKKTRSEKTVGWKGREIKGRDGGQQSFFMDYSSSNDSF